MVEVCDGCATEFMVGSLFCHVCGASREARPSTARTIGPCTWSSTTSSARLGLSTASLVAFLIGMVCLIMAGIAVGMIYSVQTFNDFQAVQLYRMQWLLGAIAAFAAGLLLKKSPDTEALSQLITTAHVGPDALVRAGEQRSPRPFHQFPEMTRQVHEPRRTRSITRSVPGLRVLVPSSRGAELPATLQWPGAPPPTWVVDHDPPLLMHAIQMMHRSGAAPQGMGIGIAAAT